MSKRKDDSKIHAGANLEYYRLVQAYGSLFRMDSRSGKTWILSQKELIWREVPEESGPSQTVTR